MSIVIGFFVCLLATEISASINPYPANEDIKFSGEPPGERIIINSYVKSGKIEEIRALTLVKNFKGNVESYSGFVTVDEECDSNLFFWFFPAESRRLTAPVSVWLQGGPGASSLFGLFTENGPFNLKPNGKLSLRQFSWTKASSYIFIDNPVGTGFSYAKSEDCYSRNQTHVGNNLLAAVKMILRMFPEIKNNMFFVTGESYAGKYVPALAYAIHKDNDPEFKINLQGLAIGNGLVDPFHQLYYSDYLYYLGLIDSNGRNYIKAEEDKCRQLISQQKWMEAFEVFDSLINGDFKKEGTYFQNVTGFRYYFNYLYEKPESSVDIASFVTGPEVRAKIHVGNAPFHGGILVQSHLKEDVVKSVKPWLEELLEHYRVLIYNGQLDIIVAYPLTVSYLKELKWSSSEEYKTAVRHIWRVNSEIAGYVKTAGNLTEVLVRNAGHMVPSDRPIMAFDLMLRFFTFKSYY